MRIDSNRTPSFTHQITAGRVLTSEIDRSQRPNRLSAGEVFGVFGLIAVQIVAAAVFYGVVILLSFNSDSCYGSGTCDYGMAGVSFYLIPITVGLVVLLSIVFAIVLTRRRRSPLLSPIGGIVVVIVAGIVAIVLNLNAFT